MISLPLPYIVILAVIICIISLVLYLIMSEKKRRQELERVSREIGFTFSPSAHIQLPGLKLFSTGHSKSKKNLLTTTSGGVQWSIFDYRFSMGRDTQEQTVAMAQLDRDLPEFSLSLEHFYHKIGDAIGLKDIDFEYYPEFSQKYRLTGKDENAVRQLFTPIVISTITSQELREHVEAKGNSIIMYTPRKRVKPEDLYGFFQKACIIVELFK